MSTSKIDKNFYDTIKILNNLKIKYFCTCGTMLGLYRDNDLIEWDEDIDIAIFAKPNEYNALISTMKDHGFSGSFQRTIRPGLPSLKFQRIGGRKVEFSTPIKNVKGEYCHEWYKVVSPQIYKSLKYYQKITHKFLKLIGRIPFQENQLGIKPCLHVYSNKKKVICLFLQVFFPLVLKLNYRLRKLTNLDSTIGYYSKKLDPNNVTQIKYHGLECKIPTYSEDICEDFYGSDWRNPKGMDHYSDFYKDASSYKFIKQK